MSGFRICGPKLSIFGTCLSVWGIIQLSFMALAFYSNSVAFVEDLPEKAFENCTEGSPNYIKPCSFEDNVNIMKEAYAQQAHNCGLAVALYIVTLMVSLHQLWMNTERGMCAIKVVWSRLIKKF